jgi:hypothetical protein
MKKILFLVLLVSFGCTHKPRPSSIHISLINNGSTLKFTGMDASVTGEIGRDSSNSVWQALIPVYKMPADTEMKDYQRAQSGKYMVIDTAVIFTPDTPFIKQQTYFVRYYKYGEGNSIMNYVDHSKKLGHPRYTDLIFKQ